MCYLSFLALVSRRQRDQGPDVNRLNKGQVKTGQNDLSYASVVSQCSLRVPLVNT